MNKRQIKVIILCAVFSIMITVSIFIMEFIHHDISNNISDWASFSNYIGGIISPIISALNLYLFYILTTTASKFTEENTKKQLFYGTCHDYQKKINELIFECLSNIELYSKNEDNIEYKEKATLRLVWLMYYIKSFYDEIGSLIPTENDIEKSISELNAAIEDLIESDFKDGKKMNNFISAKSQFINNVFNCLINNK